MKETLLDLWQMLTEPVDGFWDGVFRGIMWLFSLLFVGLVAWFLFFLVDTVGVGKKEGDGIIVSRGYHPAHITTTYVTSGKSTIPIVTYHPERWSVDIEVNGRTDEVTVSENYCNNSNEGSKVRVIYKKGRLSKGVYIKEIL